jgi:putative ABC transport system ATP-binding protein
VTIFKDLNFTIDQGTNVAIVAPSGAGKSTVASLLLRFYVPTAGTITVHGRDITTLNAKQLRRKIGFVGQEPVLFSGTIAENIAYGVPQATRAEIVGAARKANCQFISDFVSSRSFSIVSRLTSGSLMASKHMLVQEAHNFLVDRSSASP